MQYNKHHCPATSLHTLMACKVMGQPNTCGMMKSGIKLTMVGLLVAGLQQLGQA